MPQTLFWFSLLLVAYVYLGYPLLLALLSRHCPAPPTPDDAFEPSVALIVSAFNEAPVIEAKILNSLELDYPKERLTIAVASDGSTDGTNAIVERYVSEHLRLFAFPENRGKLLTLNATVERLEDEILVFSDANSIYDPKAVRRLVRHFADPKVGCVVGELRYRNPTDAAIGEGEGLYWRYEQFIKRKESEVSSLVGANGSIFAIRRALYPVLDASVINDFVHPLLIVAQGFRTLYEPQACAYESTSSAEADEIGRKVRIVNRSFNGIRHVMGLLNPFRFGIFSVQLWSHKLLRWWVPFFLLLALGANGFLLTRPFYLLAFLGQLVFYGLALFGDQLVRHHRLFYVPRYFCLVNAAALLGIVQALWGTKITTWTPRR